MCFICEMIEDETLKPYDADILAVELAPFIGFEHSQQLRTALKKFNETIKPSTIENWQDTTWFPYNNDDND